MGLKCPLKTIVTVKVIVVHFTLTYLNVCTLSLCVCVLASSLIPRPPCSALVVCSTKLQYCMQQKLGVDGGLRKKLGVSMCACECLLFSLQLPQRVLVSQ